MVSISRDRDTCLGLGDIVDRVNTTMKEAKGSIKNTTVLRTLTKL